MGHPSLRKFARYALGEISDEVELAEFEDHLLDCDECRRRALAVDLIGTAPDNEQTPMLHIAYAADPAIAGCGAPAERNVISEVRLLGMEPHLVCPRCLAIVRGRTNATSSLVN